MAPAAARPGADMVADCLLRIPGQIARDHEYRVAGTAIYP
jgi:hypothetical protein